MTSMALYPREDGLLEPRAEKSMEWVKEQSKAGRFIIADVLMNQRTALQNNYLNGWIYKKQLATKLKEAGIYMPNGMPWIRNSIHAAMQEAFLIEGEFEMNGKIIPIYESTSTMSKPRFSEYTKDVGEFSWDMWQVTIEDPREGYWRELYEEVFNR